MRRLLVPLLALALPSCEPTLHRQPALPALVVVKPPAPAVAHELLLEPGEQLIWNVEVQGLTIGRAELDVSATEVRSKFATSHLASAFAKVHDDALTILDRAAGRPRSARESYDLDGDRESADVAFAGNNRHTIHTALGWVRAWAKLDAVASTLEIQHVHRIVRLDVSPPVAESLLDRQALRVDGVIHDPKLGAIAVTMWLSADARRVPLRIAIVLDNIHVTAELIES